MMVMKGNIDMIPHVSLKQVINIELSADELNILLEAVYWQDNEMVPDANEMRRLYRKLYEARKLVRGEETNRCCC